MSIYTLQPEFCFSNFLNQIVNTDINITLSTTQGDWYQEDIGFLYDNYCGSLYQGAAYKTLYTTGCNDDTKTATILVEFNDIIFFDTIKLLNTNIKSGTIKFSVDGVTWTTIKTISDNSLTSIHWNASDYETSYNTEYTFLQSSNGATIYDHLGQQIAVSHWSAARYIEVVFSTTQSANDEKYIGELYVGQRAFKISTGKLIYYKKNLSDPNERRLTNYKGISIVNPNYAVYGCDLTYSRLTQAEHNFLEEFITNRGLYNVFPTPDFAVGRGTIDDVHLVSSTGEFNKIMWGENAVDQLSIFIREGEYVT